jgi:hypothetical protein
MRAARMFVERMDNEAPGCGRLRLLGTEKGAEAEIAFTEDRDLVLHPRKSLPYQLQWHAAVRLWDFI